MTEQRTPRAGECYRHFKGNRYEVLAVAKHTETGEDLVIYKGLYGDNPIYARPLQMFTGVIEKANFPGVTQDYRFQLEEETAVTYAGENNLLMDFLDLESNEERIMYLQQHEQDLTSPFLSAAAQSLDLIEGEGNLEERYYELLHCLRVRVRYELGRDFRK